ncbi:MAG: hypothetical protein E7641_08865 [Ruminococcaceae bacterium]|nr:hypothetical protein [Oscillospiraceae bacterium]
MIRRYCTAILAFVLVLILSLSMMSCASKAPDISEVKERFVYLIEESKELNVVFFGTGLPVYRRGDAISDRKMVYFDDELTGYDRVMENTDYLTIDEIKASAELVFSEDYLSDFYESAFDGIMTGSSSAYVRFYDDTEWLYQNVNATVFALSERIYDYSTMNIIDPSSDTYVNISVESYSLADPTRRTVYLSFVFENGNWFLDTPSY